MKKTYEIKNIGKWGAGVQWRPLPKAEALTEPADETRLHYDYLYIDSISARLLHI